MSSTMRSGWIGPPAQSRRAGGRDRRSPCSAFWPRPRPPPRRAALAALVDVIVRLQSGSDVDAQVRRATAEGARAQFRYRTALRGFSAQVPAAGRGRAAPLAAGRLGRAGHARCGPPPPRRRPAGAWTASTSERCRCRAPTATRAPAPASPPTCWTPGSWPGTPSSAVGCGRALAGRRRPGRHHRLQRPRHPRRRHPGRAAPTGWPRRRSPCSGAGAGLPGLRQHGAGHRRAGLGGGGPRGGGAGGGQPEPGRFDQQHPGRRRPGRDQRRRDGRLSRPATTTAPPAPARRRGCARP